MRRLLLLSNSRDERGRYLHHAASALSRHLGAAQHVVFVPYAGVTISHDAYTARVREAFAAMPFVGPITLTSVHERARPADAVREADAIVIGGGNTFQLLASMQHHDLVHAIRERVLGGVPYVGWSAGTVVACPTLQTTNDMPIAQPRDFEALALVDFQVNAHFTDAHPPGFQGETRRERLAEYLSLHPRMSVLGLPEGDWLSVIGPDITLEGAAPAYLFRASQPPVEVSPGATLHHLLV